MGVVFDGIDDEATFGSDASIDDWTQLSAALWIDLQSSGVSLQIVNKQSAVADEGWWLGITSTNQLRFNQYWSDSGTTRHRITADGTISTGIHQVGVTYDNSSTSNVALIYLDGVAVATTTNTTPTGGAPFADAGFTLRLGMTASGVDDFTGSMASFIYANRILTAGEMNRHYQTGQISPGTDEVWHPLNDNDASQANKGPATAPLTLVGSAVMTTALPEAHKFFGAGLG